MFFFHYLVLFLYNNFCLVILFFLWLLFTLMIQQTSRQRIRDRHDPIPDSSKKKITWHYNITINHKQRKREFFSGYKQRPSKAHSIEKGKLLSLNYIICQFASSVVQSGFYNNIQGTSLKINTYKGTTRSVAQTLNSLRDIKICETS